MYSSGLVQLVFLGEGLIQLNLLGEGHVQLNLLGEGLVKLNLLGLLSRLGQGVSDVAGRVDGSGVSVLVGNILGSGHSSQLFQVGWHRVGRYGAAELLLPLLSAAPNQRLLQVALVTGYFGFTLLKFQLSSYYHLAVRAELNKIIFFRYQKSQI